MYACSPDGFVCLVSVVGVKRGAAAIKIQARFRGMRGRMRVKEEMIRAQKEADQLVKAHARLQALKPQSVCYVVDAELCVPEA